MRRGKTTFGFRKILTTLLFMFIASGFFLAPGEAEAVGWDDRYTDLKFSVNDDRTIITHIKTGDKYNYVGLDKGSGDLGGVIFAELSKYIYVNEGSPKIYLKVNGTNKIEKIYDISKKTLDWQDVPGGSPQTDVADFCNKTLPGKCGPQINDRYLVINGTVNYPKPEILNTDMQILIMPNDFGPRLISASYGRVLEDGKYEFSKAGNAGVDTSVRPSVNLKKVSVYVYASKNGKKYDNCSNGKIPSLKIPDSFQGSSLNDSGLIGNLDFELKENASPCLGVQDNLIPTPGEVVNNALTDALKSITGSLEKVVSKMASWINKVLNSEDILPDGDVYKSPWLIVRNLALTLMAIAIVIIAFANVLSIDIERWGVAKMIPKLVIAIILAYFSYFIAELFVDLAGTITNQLWYAMQNNAGTNGGAIREDLATGLSTGVVEILLAVIMLVIMAVVLLYLGIILFARIVAINILTVLAPMAFVLGILPWTESLSKKWWSEFSKWVFMGPAIMFMLLVGNIIIAQIAGSDVSKDENGSIDSIFILFTAAVAYFMAAQIPVQMGGKAMGAVSGYVKKPFMNAGKWSSAKAGKYVKDKTRLTEAGLRLKARTSRKDAQIAYRATRGDALAAQKGGWKQWATGANESQVKAMRTALIAEEAKDMEDSGLAHQADELGKIMKDKSDPIKREAAAMLSAASGNVDTSMAIALGLKEGEKAAEDAWKKAREINGDDDPETQALEESYKTLAKENKLKVAQELGELAKNNTGLFKSLGNDFTDLAIISGNTGLENMAKGKRKVMSLSQVKGGLVESSQMRGDTDSIIKNSGNVDEVMLKGTAGAQQEMMDLHRRLSSGQVKYSNDDPGKAQKAADDKLLENINGSKYFSDVNARNAAKRAAAAQASPTPTTTPTNPGATPYNPAPNRGGGRARNPLPGRRPRP